MGSSRIHCAQDRLHELDAAGTVPAAGDQRDDVITSERQRLKALECEVKELRRANEIRKLASVFRSGRDSPP